VSRKKEFTKPVWYKNTYFLISGILFFLGIVGAIVGDHAIRDPGQKREGGLYLLYFVASVIMLVNGYISHKQTIQQFEEDQQDPSRQPVKSLEEEKQGAQ
jgi:hypothetical protein